MNSSDCKFDDVSVSSARSMESTARTPRILAVKEVLSQTLLPLTSVHSGDTVGAVRNHGSYAAVFPMTQPTGICIWQVLTS